VKRLLDFMCMTKLNVLHWHLTDDSAFPVQSR
jgi:N-acetyl-beta-hexosaminidase